MGNTYVRIEQVFLTSIHRSRNVVDFIVYIANQDCSQSIDNGIDEYPRTNPAVGKN